MASWGSRAKRTELRSTDMQYLLRLLASLRQYYAAYKPVRKTNETKQLQMQLPDLLDQLEPTMRERSKSGQLMFPSLEVTLTEAKALLEPFAKPDDRFYQPRPENVVARLLVLCGELSRLRITLASLDVDDDVAAAGKKGAGTPDTTQGLAVAGAKAAPVAMSGTPTLPQHVRMLQFLEMDEDRQFWIRRFAEDKIVVATHAMADALEQELAIPPAAAAAISMQIDSNSDGKITVFDAGVFAFGVGLLSRAERSAAHLYSPTIQPGFKITPPRPADAPPLVMWVDDNPENNVMIWSRARKAGVEVQLVRSTAEAKILLSESPHLKSEPPTRFRIMTDLGRVEEGSNNSMAGEELVRWLRGNGFEQPVMVFTSTRGLLRGGHMHALYQPILLMIDTEPCVQFTGFHSAEWFNDTLPRRDRSVYDPSKDRQNYKRHGGGSNHSRRSSGSSNNNTKPSAVPGALPTQFMDPEMKPPKQSCLIC